MVDLHASFRQEIKRQLDILDKAFAKVAPGNLVLEQTPPLNLTSQR